MIDALDVEIETLFEEQREIIEQLSTHPSNALVIEGYAALWDQRDLQGELFKPGAFAQSLDLSKGAWGVLMLYNHIERWPIGRWSKIHEDDTGLFVRGAVYPRTTARPFLCPPEVVKAVRNEEFDALSPGFVYAHDTRRGVIKAAYLTEISIGRNPAQPGARFRIVK